MRRWGDERWNRPKVSEGEDTTISGWINLVRKMMRKKWILQITQSIDIGLKSTSCRERVVACMERSRGCNWTSPFFSGRTLPTPWHVSIGQAKKRQGFEPGLYYLIQVVLIIRLNFSRSRFTCFSQLEGFELAAPPRFLFTARHFKTMLRNWNARTPMCASCCSELGNHANCAIVFRATMFVMNYFRNKELSFLAAAEIVTCAIRSAHSAVARIGRAFLRLRVCQSCLFLIFPHCSWSHHPVATHFFLLRIMPDHSQIVTC